MTYEELLIDFEQNVSDYFDTDVVLLLLNIAEAEREYIESHTLTSTQYPCEGWRIFCSCVRDNIYNKWLETFTDGAQSKDYEHDGAGYLLEMINQLWRYMERKYQKEFL